MPTETIVPTPPPPVTSVAPVVSAPPIASTKSSAPPVASLDITVTRSKEDVQRAQLQKELDSMQMEMLKALSSQGSSTQSVLKDDSTAIDLSNVAIAGSGPSKGGGSELRVGGGGGGLAGIGDTRDK